jgi:hypothetical protein
MAADPAAEFEALLAQHDLLWTTDGQVTADGIQRRLSMCADLVTVAGHDPPQREAGAGPPGSCGGTPQGR